MIKTLSWLVCVVGFTGALAASEVNVPSFRIQGEVGFLPELSLAQMTKGRITGNPEISFIPNRRPPKFIASMLIAKTADKFVHTPGGDVDYKLIVKAPDTSVDYKLNVVEIPGMEIAAK